VTVIKHVRKRRIKYVDVYVHSMVPCVVCNFKSHQKISDQNWLQVDFVCH